MQKNNDRCIFCNSKNIEREPVEFVPFIIERMFDGKEQPTERIKCGKCKIQYTSYRPTDEEMAKYYSGYRDENYQKQRQKHEEWYTKEFNDKLGDPNARKQAMNDIFLKFLNIDSIKSVLDWGGDRGQFIPECLKNAKKYVYEISNAALEPDVERISTKEDLYSRKFDLITCNHVLEHVSHPKKIIQELYELCNDNGYIFISVPKEPAYPTVHEHINNFRPETFLYNKIAPVQYVDISNNCGIFVFLKKEKYNTIKNYINLYLYKNKFRKRKNNKYKEAFIRVCKFKKICG